MNKLEIKGCWDGIKGKVKQKFARLIGDEPMYLEGKDDEILGRIQKEISRIRKKIRPVPAGPPWGRFISRPKSGDVR